MIHTRLDPDPKCSHCSGTGRVWKPFDCECLLREAKTSLWRRAVKALSRCSGEPQPKGRSMVAGRRDFMKLMATGAVAAALPVPKPAPLKPLIMGMSHDLKIIDEAQPMREHGMAWYSIYGSNVLESQNIVLMETA